MRRILAPERQHPEPLGRAGEPPSVVEQFDESHGQRAPQAMEPRLPRREAPSKRGAYPFLVSTRPRQWIKNLLVFAAPALAGLLGRPGVLARSALAAALFLLASAGTYLLNDVIDAPRDRAHPKKALRPIASGALSPGLALGGGAILLGAAIGCAPLVGGRALLAVVGTYAIVSILYSCYLKQVPVIELACVASGFVLRAVAGGAAVHIAISPWFVIVTAACSLLVVTGKRSSELATLGTRSSEHRAVLAAYPMSFLRSVRLLAGTTAVLSYALWAFARAAHLDTGHGGLEHVVFELSIIPFATAILCAELAFETGRGDAPEDLALKDTGLQLLGLACLVLLMIGIYT
ncbi:MAG: decaprenyl-phosphate phosphoribosyltransferase [Acidimicrobiales bacterium]